MDEREDQIERNGPGRRENDWQTPRFWVSVLGLLLTVALVLLSAIWNRVSSIDSGVQALAITTNGQAKDIAAQQRELEEFKRNQKAADDIRDAYMTNARERIVKLESQVK